MANIKIMISELFRIYNLKWDYFDKALEIDKELQDLEHELNYYRNLYYKERDINKKLSEELINIINENYELKLGDNNGRRNAN